MKTFALTLTAFALLSFSVRADDKTEKLVGKWEMTKGEVVGLTAEFSKDGKVKVSRTVNVQDQDTREGTYKLDGNTLKVTSKDGGMERTESFKVKKLTDKELIIEDKDKDIEFKKVM